MRLIPVALAVSLLLAPSALAAATPTAFEATYNEADDTLEFTWNQSGSLTDVTWRVYRDGTHIATTTDTSYDEDISSWTHGTRTYWVTSVEGGSESGMSNVVKVTKSPEPILPPCGPLVIIITSFVPPRVRPVVRPECLP